MKKDKQILTFSVATGIALLSLLWFVSVTNETTKNKQLTQVTISKSYQSEAISKQALQDTIRKREAEIMKRIHEIMASASLCR